MDTLYLTISIIYYISSLTGMADFIIYKACKRKMVGNRPLSNARRQFLYRLHPNAFQHVIHACIGFEDP